MEVSAWIFALLGVLTGLLIGLILNRLQLRRRWQTWRQQLATRRQPPAYTNWRALYELTSTMMSTLNYQRVLDISQDVAIKALSPPNKIERLVSAVLVFEEDGQLHVQSARRFPPSDWRAVFPAREGALAHVVSQRVPMVRLRPSEDPELRRLVAMHACAAVYLHPLVSGADVFGVLLFAHPDEHFFSATRREILDIICNQATIALENARLYQDLVNEKRRLAETEDNARKKLARDLHDGPTQSVAAIAMRLNFIQRLLDKDPQAAKQEIAKVEELARRTTQEIRHMLFTMRPLILESEGLAAALRALADKMRETYGQQVLVEVDESLIERLDTNEQTVIFHIAEEAVNNARKHAQAAHIWVRLIPASQHFAVLEVADDGVGFDVDEVMRNYQSRGSLGLLNLQERAAIVHGYLEIDSTPGKGTQVRLWIPLTEVGADLLRQGKRPRT